MKMNKKGFTLIEILAVIIILGIVSTIGIAAISRNIDNSRRSSFANIGRNYVESARAMRTEDKLPTNIAKEEILILPFSSVTGVDIENAYKTPYGELNLDYSYVIIYNKDNKIYSYYLTMLDDSNHGINMVDINELKDKDIFLDEDGTIKNIENLSTITVDGVFYSVSSEHDIVRDNETNKIRYIKMRLPKWH